MLRPNSALTRIGTIGPPAVHFQSLGHIAVAPSGRIYDADGNLYSPDGLSLVKYTQSGKLLAR